MRKRVDYILEDIYGENAYRRVSDSAKKDAFQRKEVTGLKQLKLYSWSTVLDANETDISKRLKLVKGLNALNFPLRISSSKVS